MSYVRTVKTDLTNTAKDRFLGNRYEPDRTFRLLEELRKTEPFYEDQAYLVYRVPDTLAEVVPHLAYFGTSIFWRSAAFPWKNLGKPLICIELGARYLEEFRQFLLGEAKFPTNAALVVEISDETNRLANVFNTPFSRNTGTNYLHWIDIAGLHFNLFVGARIPHEIHFFSAYPPGEPILAIAKNKEAFMRRMYRKQLKAFADTKRT